MQNNLKKLLLLPSILFAHVCLLTNGLNGGLVQPNNEVYSQKVNQETSLAKSSRENITPVVSYVHILYSIAAMGMSILLLQRHHEKVYFNTLSYQIAYFSLITKITVLLKKQYGELLNVSLSVLFYNAFYSVHHASSSRI